MTTPAAYTHGHHPSVLQAHSVRTAQDCAAYLLPHLQAGQDLLDIGCGPGTITLDLAEIVAPGRVVGVENVEAPLTAARANAAGRGDTGTVFELADVYELPYEDGSFDVVHAHQVLQHLTDPVAALHEMARVCVPRGTLAVRDADYAAMSWWPESEGLTRWLDTYRTLARANGAEPDAGRRLRQWAQDAELHDLRLSTSNWLYASEHETRWWGRTWAARATQSAFADQARERGLVDDTGLAEISAAWLEWGESPDAWFVIVHGELLARP